MDDPAHKGVTEIPVGDSPAGVQTCPQGHPVSGSDRFCTTCGQTIQGFRTGPSPTANPPPGTGRRRRGRGTVALVVVLVLGAGGLVAALLVLNGPTKRANVPLAQAVADTLGASGFSEHLTESTPNGNQTADLVYQAPNRLGGWLASAGHRTYLVIIGGTEYIGTTQPGTDRVVPRSYTSQATTGAATVDPAHTYLPYYSKGRSHTFGGITTVTLHSGTQTETLTYSQDGGHVSTFRAVTPGGTITLDIGSVGVAPAVSLPAGYTAVPGTASTTPGTASG